MNSKTAWTNPDTTVSQSTAGVDSLSLESDEGVPLTVDNWSVNLDSTQTGNFLDGALLYKFGRIKAGQSDLGSIEAGGKVAHVDMAALAVLGDEYNKKASDSREETADSEHGQELRDNHLDVMASEPVVSYGPFTGTT